MQTSSLRELLLRIEGEYREMPGLSLTASQAGRLWGLDSMACRVALTVLVERRVLKQTTCGTYLRGPSASSHVATRSAAGNRETGGSPSEKEPQPS
jgi:hypothetical protein